MSDERRRIGPIVVPTLVLTLAFGLSAAFLSPAARAQDKPQEKPQEAAAKTDEKKAETPKARVVVFRLSGQLNETPREELFNLGDKTTAPLLTLVRRLDKAAADKEVKAVVILIDQVHPGKAQVGELRRALRRVVEAGKDVYAHADSISSLSQYALLSSAGTASATPTADLWATGIYAETPYLRGLLDKIGVEPDFLALGDYKSAAEIFTRDGPSKEAEEMQNWLLDGLYDSLVSQIAESRKVAPELVKAWIDSGPHSAEKARELGMLDVVEHRQDLEARLKKAYGDDVVFDRKYGEKAEPKLDASSPFGLLKFWGELLGAAKPDEKKKDAVAVVYVDGPIVATKSETAELFQERAAASDALRKALDEAAADDTIKAVALRIDSPGGSALASEIILDATRRVKAKKPFVVSMGDVAASGGYYVSCAAETIFADEATITGSIGVVAGKLATKDLFNKLGVTFKANRRGQNAGMLASGEPFSAGERQKLQEWMDEIYDVFKKHVTDARGEKLKKPIDELAGGRVYTGKQALELGLVDKLGTLADAVKFAADAAKITDYEVRVIPRPQSFLERLLDESDDDKGLMKLVSPSSFLFNQAIPVLKALDPDRADLVRSALGRLELIHREGVVLMAPELGLSR